MGGRRGKGGERRAEECGGLCLRLLRFKCFKLFAFVRSPSMCTDTTTHVEIEIETETETEIETEAETQTWKQAPAQTKT